MSDIIGPQQIAQELEDIVTEFGKGCEYLEGVDALLGLYYRRSMMSEEMQKNIGYELVWHYENIKENTYIEEIEVNPKPYKIRKLEWN